MKVYTHNDKVLTNSANGKWLKEKEPFVMNADNIVKLFGDHNHWAVWNGPEYPNSWDGNGIRYEVTLTEDIVTNSETPSQPGIPLTLYYGMSPDQIGGPAAATLIEHVNGVWKAGTYTGTLNQDPVSTFGAQLQVQFAPGSNETPIEQASKITIKLYT